jgi:hypothetical protein
MDGLDALDGFSLIKEKGESVVAYSADGKSQEPSLDALVERQQCRIDGENAVHVVQHFKCWEGSMA